MFFKKKIVFTDKMNETLRSFDEIPWFSCCGVPYDEPSYYPYLQEKDPKRAEKLLLHTKNYSGTVCLTNLFKEGICRADTFILQTAGWKFYQNEFMPCVEASWRTYEKRASKVNGLDLNSVGKRFLRDCGFPDSIDLQLCRMVQYLLVEQYFLERFPQFPLFFSRIIDIYKDGHIVLGWNGRFASHETNLEHENGTPILQTDGHMDFFSSDTRYVKSLNGISEMKQYQLREMLKKLYSIYSVKNHRNLLVAPDSFAYLFEDSDLENRTKSGFILLAKDLKNKYGIHILIVRPKAMLTKNYVNVPPEIEQEFLAAFGNYATPLGFVSDRVEASRNPSRGSDIRIRNHGKIYSVQMGELWENHFANYYFWNEPRHAYYFP